MSVNARRAITAIGVLALAALALAVFVLPFAFPTPPPIITRFQATQVFSPNEDARRDQATVSIRVLKASTVSLNVRRDGNTVARLITDREEAPGWVRVTWDGRSDDGEVLPDGAYAFQLRARSGEKRFNASRRVVLDTAAPRVRAFRVVSASLAGPGAGQCRVTLTSEDDVSVRIEAIPPGGGEAVASVGPRPVRAGGSTTWAWNGRSGDSSLEPGLYTLRARLQDAPGNRRSIERTCWVGNMIGSPRGGGSSPIGARLTNSDGSPVPAGTPVSLSIHRRVGTPGRRTGPVVGARLSGPVAGTAAGARITIPPGPRRDMWLIATAREAQALIPLFPRAAP